MKSKNGETFILNRAMQRITLCEDILEGANLVVPSELSKKTKMLKNVAHNVFCPNVVIQVIQFISFCLVIWLFSTMYK